MRTLSRTALAVAFLFLASLGGCKVDTGVSPSETKVFDLTSPPSRAVAGLGEGQTQHTFQTPDHKPFPIQVKLPLGKELAFDAKLVGFDSLKAPRPPSDPPSTMDIQYFASTLEEGRDHLVAALRDFGMDPSAAGTWYEKAKSAREAKKADDVRTPWLSGKVGYLDLQIQGGYLSSGSAQDQTVVHYVFAWSVK